MVQAKGKEGEPSFFNLFHRHVVVPTSSSPCFKQIIKGYARLIIMLMLVSTFVLRANDQPGGERFREMSQKEEYPSKINVFYNLFVKDETDASRVLEIVKEQLSLVLPDEHGKVSIISIGHQLNLPNISIETTMQPFESASEDATLSALWNYCKDPKNNNHETKVAYIHSKGSYHPTPANTKLRSFLTKGVLSKECANLPDTCNMCSSRMSPLPHPHTPGNMWLARCSYISKLIDPYAKRDEKLPRNFHQNNPCKGFGRSFFEHWAHSHPSVMPCDLYPGKEFTWAYNNIPSGDYVPEMHKAPRFELDVYKRRACQASNENIIGQRLWSYEQLYNISTLDETWWGWDVFNATKQD